MGKIVKNTARKIADYLKEIVDDELTVMDAFFDNLLKERKQWM